jgi:hypothetical protein
VKLDVTIPKNETEPVRGLAARKAYVLHTETLVLGRAARFYAPGEFIDESDNPIPEEVLELEEGHRFLASDPSRFVEIPPDVADYYRAMQSELRTLLVRAVGALAVAYSAKGIQPDPSVAQLLFRAALAEQLRILSAG